MSSHSDAGVMDRRGFIATGAATGAGAAVGAGALEALLPSFAAARGKKGGVTKGDLAILGAAQIAEALAVTTYTGIVDDAPFFARLEADDQQYFKAARQEEMAHYLLERSVTRKPAAATTFYFPPRMFDDAQTTLNVLVTLEEAFIAAYLVGVRRFSSPDLRVTAARIMGIESDHRILARVVAPTLSIEHVTGIEGRAESVDPPNNNTYERTLRWARISKAVEALTPFIDKRAAARAGFDTSRPFRFEPFTPTLPSRLGDFHSFVA
ncbi:MAG: ferritin-like domain-containing protein [Actinobacteria bacterium]|nr:ferritin-like domain-containing protein [Actinomycetota bacterium]